MMKIDSKDIESCKCALTGSIVTLNTHVDDVKLKKTKKTRTR